MLLRRLLVKSNADYALWLKIHTRFQDLSRERNVKSDSKDLAHIKNKVKNLEYEFKQVKMRMNQTGKEGAEKIKKDCSYYEELNSFLGNRDAINPDRVNITSTEIKKQPCQNQRRMRLIHLHQ